MINSGVYKITCSANGKIYIGSAKNISVRLRAHFNYLALNKHRNSHLQSAYNLYGGDKFFTETIELVPDVNNLISREQYWLDKTQCFNRLVGFNICVIAGSSLGVKRSEEFKEKIRQANLNRTDEIKENTISAVKKANTGRRPHNKGTKMWANKPHPKGGLGKKYPNRKFGKEGYKIICEANRRPRGEQYLVLRSELSSKVYYFWTPEGCPVKIDNLSEFCNRWGLNKSRMYQVAKGNEPSHKGWIVDPDCCPEIVERWQSIIDKKRAA